jgi:hypothetical protein
MQNPMSGASGFLRCIAVVWVAGLLTGGTATAPAKSADDLDIVTISTRPDTVSGGNVLVRINAPRGAAINDLVVLLNGQNVTGVFRPETGRHSLLGLVDGLAVGENSLVAKAVGPNNEAYRSAEATLTNYPITGPILSGPHEEPFYCMTQLCPAGFHQHIGAGTRRRLFDCDQSRLCLPHDGRDLPASGKPDELPGRLGPDHDKRRQVCALHRARRDRDDQPRHL